MVRYITINIHTEDLANDKTFKHVRRLVKLLNKQQIKASWFVFAHQDRIKYLAEHNQVIEQHTHFYKTNKQGESYDLSRTNVLDKLNSDKEWLRENGYDINGFISGAWKVNQELLQILNEQRYKYDLSVNNIKLDKQVSIKKLDGLLIIPATATIRRLFLDLITFRAKRRFLAIPNQENTICTLHFHDFDLNKFSNRLCLKLIILLKSLFKYQFTTHQTL